MIAYMQRHFIPFEYMDAWVPSFINNDQQANNQAGSNQKCRLCFAGCATAEIQVHQEGRGSLPITKEV